MAFTWLTLSFTPIPVYDLTSTDTSLFETMIHIDVGGGESDEDKEKLAELERERLEAIREAEERRAAKHAKMEAERENMRQGVRDKVSSWT